MINTDKIQEHMEVVGADGGHVGTVDGIEGTSKIKLTKSDPASKGQHQFVPVEWVDRVDNSVHLKKSANDVIATFKAA